MLSWVERRIVHCESPMASVIAAPMASRSRSTGRVSVPEHIDTAELFFEAIEHKVAFVPGEQFYGENAERNHMRINFSFVSKEDLAEAVRRLADCMNTRL